MGNDLNERSSVAAVQFALETDDGLEFLRMWNEGEFDIIRREWPEAPEAIYIGADPLRTPIECGGCATPVIAIKTAAQPQAEHHHAAWSPFEAYRNGWRAGIDGIAMHEGASIEFFTGYEDAQKWRVELNIARDDAARSLGYINFNSMQQCANAWADVFDALQRLVPGWVSLAGTAKDSAVAAIEALAARQPVDGDVYRRLHEIAHRDSAVSVTVRADDLRAILAARQPVGGPVAVVGDTYTLHWIGSGPIAPLIEHHGIKKGDKLYTAPPAAVDLSTMRRDVERMTLNPSEGDVVYRAGFNGAIACVVALIDSKAVRS